MSNKEFEGGGDGNGHGHGDCTFLVKKSPTQHTGTAGRRRAESDIKPSRVKINPLFLVPKSKIPVPTCTAPTSGQTLLLLAVGVGPSSSGASFTYTVIAGGVLDVKRWAGRSSGRSLV